MKKNKSTFIAPMSSVWECAFWSAAFCSRLKIAISMKKLHLSRLASFQKLSGKNLIILSIITLKIYLTFFIGCLPSTPGIGLTSDP